MPPRFGIALTLALGLCPSSNALAQVVIESSTTTTAEVTVTGRVTTTTTERLIEPVPVVVVAPSPPSGPSSGLSFHLVPRGELTLGGSHDGVLAGMSTLLAFLADDGWGGGLVVGYHGVIMDRAPSEVHLALEAWRDFHPRESVSFLLVARAGTALVLAHEGPSPRVLGQLGVGTRVAVDPHVGIVLDVRGELRVRPAGSELDADMARGPELTAGGVITMGLAIRLD